MNTKILSAFLLTAFLLVFSISAVSAATVVFTQGTTSQDVNLGFAGAEVSGATISVEESQTVAVSTTANASGSLVTVSASPNYDYLDTGKLYTGAVVVSNGTANETINIILVKRICDDGTVNASDLDFEAEINNQDSKDDETWLLLDNIEIDVKFSNDRDKDDGEVQDVTIELGLFDEDGRNVADDLTWNSKDEEEFDAKDVDGGDNVKHTFAFRVPSDFDEGDYVLMIKASNDDFCLDNGFGSSTYYQVISIERESDDERQVIFDDISIEPSTSACGTEVAVSAKIYNIGDRDQDAVKIFLYNKELGINMNTIIENFDMDDDGQLIDFLFKVPSNASEKQYTLELSSIYDYDEDDDDDENFDNSAFSEESEVTKVYLTVLGSCLNSANTGSASITAEFSDETPNAVAGKQVIIEATVKNTGNSTMNYTVDVIGNSGWSAVKEIDPKTFTLSAGESKKVSIYLDIDDDAEGDQDFTIKVTHGLTSTEQKVNLEVEKGFTFGKIGEHLKNNWIIYVIVLVNLILIIAIVVVIAKMVGASKA